MRCLIAGALLLLPLASAAHAQSCCGGWSGYAPTVWSQGIPPGFSPTAWGQGIPWGFTPTTWAPGHFAMPGCGWELAAPAIVVPPMPTAPTKEALPLPRPADPEKPGDR
jgi:hypothetical protein